MIPKDKSEYAQGGMMTDGGGIGEPQDYHKLNIEFLKIFSECKTLLEILNNMDSLNDLDLIK